MAVPPRSVSTVAYRSTRQRRVRAAATPRPRWRRAIGPRGAAASWSGFDEQVPEQRCRHAPRWSRCPRTSSPRRSRRSRPSVSVAVASASTPAAAVDRRADVDAQRLDGRRPPARSRHRPTRGRRRRRSRRTTRARRAGSTSGESSARATTRPRAGLPGRAGPRPGRSAPGRRRAGEPRTPTGTAKRPRASGARNARGERVAVTPMLVTVERQHARVRPPGRSRSAGHRR